jgi:hypothetical protein
MAEFLGSGKKQTTGRIAPARRAAKTACARGHFYPLKTTGREVHTDSTGMKGMKRIRP